MHTPVVFLIFRRPQTTQRVFEAIRLAKPKQLLVVADGPREDRQGEAEKCQQTRQIIETVDWDCEVFTNYSDINLGCRERVASGLTWAFSLVEEAIILEDDCLPHPSFFPYCEELLKRYRYDTRIMAISGDNFQDGHQRTPYSYYFSKYFHCWGWATWKRAWQFWEFSLEKWQEFRDGGLFRLVCDLPEEYLYWHRNFESLYNNEINTWDWIYLLNCWMQSGLTILPNVNLVSNIGFGSDATHTIGEAPQSTKSMYEVREIVHPPFVLRHVEADIYTFLHFCGGLDMIDSKKPQKVIYRKIKKLLELLRQTFDLLSL